MSGISTPLPLSDSQILNLSYDAIFLLDLQGTILFWNRGAEEMYGWKPSEALRRVSHELLRTRFPMPLPQIIERLERDGRWSGELVHTARDGRQLIVSAQWALERDSSGRPTGFLEVNRDVTQQRITEREHSRLAALVECSHDAIISKSLDGIVETWNTGAEELYGYSKSEAVGHSINIIIPPELAGEETDILNKVRKGQRTPHFDTVRVRKDGTPVNVSLTIFPIRDSSSRVIGASHVARDITERKRFENQIRAMNESLERRVQERTRELQETNRELETFSYSVSHDLRAPLRSIDGFSRLLLEETPPNLDEKVIERLHRIRAATGRMSQLIDALLDLSRLSRTEMRHERVGLSTLAARIARELERAAPERRVTFTIQPNLTATGDPRLLRVLLENLLGNAFKFTAKAPEAVIEFGSRVQNAEEVLFVKDNGVGFDMQYAGDLFVPFQRLHNKTEFEGTGIGLATVRRIVARHGGRIWAEAAPDSGATFYFTLGRPMEVEWQAI
jgi:PAS domain S-box-containing protein